MATAKKKTTKKKAKAKGWPAPASYDRPKTRKVAEVDDEGNPK